MHVLHLFLTSIGATSASRLPRIGYKAAHEPDLVKRWSIEGLTIDGLSPEAFVIVAIATGLIAVAAIAVLAIAVWRSRHKRRADELAMAALTRARRPRPPRGSMP